MSLPTPRPSVAALPAYIPGARGQADRQPPIKLSSNESPWGPLPSVVEAVARAGATLNRYPDMFAVELHSRIADSLGVLDDQVAVGGGSVAVLQHLLQAYTGAGDEVMFAWRSFEAYPILAPIAGATPVHVPLTDESRHDLGGMAAAVTDRTKVIIVCSPNNPTGPAIRHDEFEAFMATVPQRVLVVLDEAYVEFGRDSDTVDGLAALKRHPNLVVTRTFSKAYGLAGARVGYAVGSADLIAPVRACVTPFSVSTVAQVAAAASLDAVDELLERVQASVDERPRLRDGLREQGWDIPVAEGNFVWIPAGKRAVEIAAELSREEPAILVRPFDGEGIRVTIGTPAENGSLLSAMARIGV